jgi:ubiquinone/menaquinone biosynthesis C-methylase UbiE
MDDVSEATRRVYHAQHLRLLHDAAAMRRHLAMFQEDYFGLGPGWFTGRRVLDAGCGDTAKGAIRYHQFGAREVHGIDLGEAWIAGARQSLEREGVPAGAIELRSGSVLAIPYPDASFDFVACHGVLVHLADVASAVAAFAELARVTAPGGYLYTVYGLVGGLLEDAVWPALRAYYRDNAEFRAFVDTLAPPVLHAVIRKIVDDMQRHTGETDDLSALFPLLDVDFCVYIQNALQAPVRLAIPEGWVREQYARHGFEDVRRLKRYVKRTNIRKYEAPLHFDREHPVSRLLYGSGNLEFIARRS